jgi:hypothetical protein
MAFSTTSYLAGVASVVTALTIGFSGGFFFAAPTPNDAPNRLQRVTSSAPLSSPAQPQAATAPKQDSPKQEMAEAASAPGLATATATQETTAVASVSATPAPGPDAAAPVAVAAAPVVAVAAVPASPPATLAQQPAAVAPASVKDPEAVHAAVAREPAEPEHLVRVNGEKTRAAEASRAAEKEKRRIDVRKLAERRKQREIQVAAGAVRRMLRDRDVQEVAVTDDGYDRRGDDTDRREGRRGSDSPAVGFFGQ